MREQIKKIYEVMADKTISLWCKVSYYKYSWIDTILGTLSEVNWDVYGIPECNFWSKWAYKTKSGYVVFTDEKTMDEHIKARKEYEIRKGTGTHFWLYRNLNDSIIIWHPVMIWDALDFFQKNYHSVKREKLFDMLDFCVRWEDKIKPIEEQSQECIDFVESLIPKV